MSKENLIYGIRPIQEAFASQRDIEKLYIRRGSSHFEILQLKKMAHSADVPVVEVPVEKLNYLVKGNHQDIVALVSAVSYANLESLVLSIFENGENPALLLLDRITDVRNFGAIARSAACAGFHAIVIPASGSAGITGDAIKTSAGALNSLPVCRVASLKDAVFFLKDSGVHIAAISEKNATPYYHADLNRPCAFILGSEEDGISPALLKMADSKLIIPMTGTISSLNVSVAAGIVMFESLRQKNAK
ncbi:MAG: rRNA ((2251)-2-O)-methyltransferase RlmB [Bacteroidota bacterium]